MRLKLSHSTDDSFCGIGASILHQCSVYSEHLLMLLVFYVELGQVHPHYMSAFRLLLHLIFKAVVCHRNVKCGSVLQECFSGFVRIHSDNGG
jgi:hypothetical protein